MTVLYQLAVLGAPTEAQLHELQVYMANAVGQFNLRLGHEVGWEILPATFQPHQLHSSAAVFFGGDNPGTANLEELLERGIPILPVASHSHQAQAEIPPILRPLHCLDYSAGGVQSIATALLGCIGLLPQQRRIMISYRRDEAREAASQLFSALSARHFEVFLDAHDMAPEEALPARSWYQLYDSDVLVMLDTPTYFDSRWTSAEFGRVLAKGISVLRVGWPDATPSIRTATACRAELLPQEIDPDSGRMAEEALVRICLKLEEVRSQNHAVRFVNLISNIRIAIQEIGGRMLGAGINKAVYVELPGDKHVVVTPTVGVPTPMLLHDAFLHSPDQSVAVVYDHIGLHPKGVGHLDWLDTHPQASRWIKASEACGQFANWRN